MKVAEYSTRLGTWFDHELRRTDPVSLKINTLLFSTRDKNVKLIADRS